MIAATLALASVASFRPPAVPLITHSPFFSVWSMADKLTDDWPRHWTRQANAMCGMVRIDGKTYRWMGPNVSSPETPALDQTGLQVTATRSIYSFMGGGIKLEVTFCSPMIADEIELVGRPVSYIQMSASSADGRQHEVETYMDWTGEWVVHDPSSSVVASRYEVGKRPVLAMRGSKQDVLATSGDQVRVNWGTLYVVGIDRGWIAGHETSRRAFANGKVPDDDMRFPRPAHDDWPVVALSAKLDKPKTFAVAYDEDFAIELLRRKLRPYWNRKEIGPTALLRTAIDEESAVMARAKAFDEKLWADLDAAGGPEYAQMGSLAFRQCLAGHAVVEDLDGDLLMFSKENTSNGCIATVDVTFPASPFFLFLNPKLLEAQVRPIMEYSAMPRWKFPFAPHDLGQYPLANGQVYGGGEVGEENQMPVEESANMLLMIAALSRSDAGAFAKPYLPVLKKWAEYLKAKGLDPENQLCTDDFTGHLAHNANLSIKAILALAAYGEVAGDASYGVLAKKLASDWMKMAADGDHTKLAFDKPGTWSQKYNLLWDRILGYNLFPESLITSELAWYKKQQNVFGFPLDNRAKFTKTDWLMWCAALAPTKAAFQDFSAPVYKWLSEMPSRVPFTDWYETISGETRGMHTRTVIGGIFARALLDRKRLR